MTRQHHVVGDARVRTARQGGVPAAADTDRGQPPEGLVAERIRHHVDGGNPPELGTTVAHAPRAVADRGEPGEAIENPGQQVRNGTQRC